MDVPRVSLTSSSDSCDSEQGVIEEDTPPSSSKKEHDDSGIGLTPRQPDCKNLPGPSYRLMKESSVSHLALSIDALDKLDLCFSGTDEIKQRGKGSTEEEGEIRSSFGLQLRKINRGVESGYRSPPGPSGQLMRERVDSSSSYADKVKPQKKESSCQIF